MKLCEYCVTNVLESKVSWDYHSHSYRALEVESKFQCLFCSTLREDIKRVAPWLKESDYTGTWPIYRWSIRSLVKIRESPETVVVTFRYVPPEKGPDGDSSKKDDIELQKRTFFLFPENDLQPLPNAEYLGNTTNPADNGGHQVRSWVVNCDRTHTDCMRRKKAMPKARSFVPTRLLDISGKPGAHIKVVETAKTSVQGPYCSLSHSWGPKPNFVRLLRNNINLFTTEGVPWSLFTKNFKEAVEIARTLDIGYIWIDSLCIIQMDAQDWEHEASRMHLVYRNSYCNIALADAIDQYGGAFRGREPESVLPVQYKSKKDSPMFHGKKWRIVPEDLWTRELLHSRLYTRGWVFQERMLSPRILHFAKNQIFWDCPSLSACEALPAGLPRPMDSTAAPDRHWRGRLQESEGSQDIAGSNDQPLSTFWQTAVRNYTSCELTKRKDKLIALWGIAKLIKDVMGVEYGEGLWEDHLEDQLTWRVAECKHEERPVTEDRHIPSWSWASMDGEIIIADRLSDKEHRTICDHNGHDLELDLKGVKRYARSSLLPRRPSGPGPMLKQRVQSDSVLEVKHSTTKAHNDQSAHYDGTHPQTSSNAAKVDEDAEPTLHHSSIAIQGHINSGILELDQSKNSWILRLNGKETFDMDAYPDTVPDRTRLEHTTKFVVLSTKKVVKPRKEWIPAGSSGDIELEGRGILLEPVSDKAKDHFRRVGAFEFRGASAQTFDRLLVTDGWERLSSKEFDPKLGRKFWLV